MKSFLTGLSLGVTAAVLLRKYGRSTEPRSNQPRSTEPKRLRTLRTVASPDIRAERPINSAVSLPERVGANQHKEVVATAEAPAGIPRPEPSPGKPASSPEEVLNSATRQQLLSVYGIGPVLADRIIQNRPYATVYDVVKQGIIPESIFVQLRKQLLDRRGA
jgi:hypothetical protein